MLQDAEVNPKVPQFSSKVSLWASLGPLIVLLTGWVLLLKVAHQYTYLPLVAPLGVPICLIWKWRGLYLSGFTLLLVTAWCVFSGSSHAMFWQIGMALAIFLGLVITVLSLEEVGESVKQLEAESQSRLQHVKTLDERWKGDQERWTQEKEGLNTRVESLKGSIEQKNRLLQTLRHCFKAVKNDLATIKEERKGLFLRWQKEQQSVQKLLSENSHLKIAHQDLVTKQQEQKILSKRISYLENDNQSLLTQNNKLRGEFECSHLEKQRLREELQGKQLKIQNLEKMIGEKPKEAKNYQALYMQLKEQFREKSEVLDQTRRELFAVKEELLAAQHRHTEVSHYRKSEVEKNFTMHLFKLDQEIASLEKQHTEEIGLLQGLVSSLMAQKS